MFINIVNYVDLGLFEGDSECTSQVSEGQGLIINSLDDEVRAFQMEQDRKLLNPALCTGNKKCKVMNQS